VQTVLGIFTKAPIPGKVKTRTHSLLSPEEAAKLHRALVLDTLQVSRGVAERRILFVAEGVDHPFIQEAATHESLEVVPQEGKDLGARMQNAFQYAGASSGNAVCLIGTDSPHVPKQFLVDAYSALQTKPAVLGPANDLGYYLIGLCGGVPPLLFSDINWGSAEVLPTTLQRLEALKMAYSLLPFWYDIDTPQDISFLQKHLPALLREDPSRCPELVTFLRALPSLLP
jgi:rSAM/selenodomain-associated transferase 1